MAIKWAWSSTSPRLHSRQTLSWYGNVGITSSFHILANILHSTHLYQMYTAHKTTKQRTRKAGLSSGGSSIVDNLILVNVAQNTSLKKLKHCWKMHAHARKHAHHFFTPCPDERWAGSSCYTLPQSKIGLTWAFHHALLSVTTSCHSGNSVRSLCWIHPSTASKFLLASSSFLLVLLLWLMVWHLLQVSELLEPLQSQLLLN